MNNKKENKNKSVWLIILVIILIIISGYFLFFKSNNSTLKPELRDFAVEDTGNVTKIFIVDKSNNSVTLERKRTFWMVNNKYKARKDAIYTLLKTLNRMEVKSPVPKSQHNTVVKLLSTSSTKVEIYTEDKLIKTIYVGGPTSNHLGTNMLLEGSSVPFVLHLPGFNGYLSTRFFIEEHLWRSTEIFNYRFDQIASVTVDIPDKPEQSFKVINYGNNQFGLEPLNKLKKIECFDTVSVKTYLGYFKNISFQSLLVDMSPEKIDSIINSKPYYIIEVEDVFGNTNSVKTFYMPPEKGVLNDEGNEFEFDPNQLYGYINNEDMSSVQFYVFDPLFKELNDFLNN